MDDKIAKEMAADRSSLEKFTVPFTDEPLGAALNYQKILR